MEALARVFICLPPFLPSSRNCIGSTSHYRWTIDRSGSMVISASFRSVIRPSVAVCPKIVGRTRAGKAQCIVPSSFASSGNVGTERRFLRRPRRRRQIFKSVHHSRRHCYTFPGGHSHSTSALRGRGDGRRANSRPDRLRQRDSGKAEGGLKIPKFLWTSYADDPQRSGRKIGVGLFVSASGELLRLLPGERGRELPLE